LRRRFVKAETALFRVKYESDDARERELFLKSRDFQWNEVLNDNTNSSFALTVSLGST
jgi:DNA primase large subunit